jgi:cytolysin-activating lysine-acyltransferase
MSHFAELGHVVNLMGHSWLHSDWTISDIHRRLIPPMALGQCMLVWSAEDALVAFASYASLSDEVHASMQDGPIAWQPEHWNSGPNLWLVEVIAPWGHGRMVCSILRKHLRDSGHAGKKINFSRRYPDHSRRVSEAQI